MKHAIRFSLSLLLSTAGVTANADGKAETLEVLLKKMRPAARSAHVDLSAEIKAAKGNANVFANGNDPRLMYKFTQDENRLSGKYKVIYSEIWGETTEYGFKIPDQQAPDLGQIKETIVYPYDSGKKVSISRAYDHKPTRQTWTDDRIFNVTSINGQSFRQTHSIRISSRSPGNDHVFGAEIGMNPKDKLTVYISDHKNNRNWIGAAEMRADQEILGMRLDPNGRRLNVITTDGWEYEYDITMTGVSGPKGQLQVKRVAERLLPVNGLNEYLVDVKNLKAAVNANALAANRGLKLAPSIAK